MYLTVLHINRYDTKSLTCLRKMRNTKSLVARIGGFSVATPLTFWLGDRILVWEGDC